MPNSSVRCSGCRGWIKRTDPALIRVGISHYCSRECFYSKKPAHHAPKRGAMDTDVRAAVIESDSNRCRYCGRMLDLRAHHVRYRNDPDSSDEPSNLITLCGGQMGLNCHDLIHSDKVRYKPLCLGIIWRREVYGDSTTLIPELEQNLERLFSE